MTMRLTIILSILLYTQSYVLAQETATVSRVVNPKFAKVIDKYLDESIPLITVDELHENMDAYIILDAREAEEYMTSHIPTAKYVGYEKPDFSAVENMDKDQKIILYCSIGYRSEKIGEKLTSMGYSNVYNLYGSIFEWANRNYTLHDFRDSPTNAVHGYNKKWSKWIDNPEVQVSY